MVFTDFFFTRWCHQCSLNIQISLYRLCHVCAGLCFPGFYIFTIYFSHAWHHQPPLMSKSLQISLCCLCWVCAFQKTFYDLLSRWAIIMSGSRHHPNAGLVQEVYFKNQNSQNLTSKDQDKSIRRAELSWAELRTRTGLTRNWLDN